MKKITFLFILSVLISACASLPYSTSTKISSNYRSLSQEIHKAFSDSVFSDAFWGVKIKSLKTGQTIYQQNESKLFIPASNTKIPTTAATLLELGPHFTFETLLYTDGQLSDSILNGNLYIKGTGDPSLYENLFDSTTAVFYDWSRILKEKGIKKINGNLIGDESAFNDERWGSGWNFDDFEYYYSAEFAPLQLNENYIDLKIVPPSHSSLPAQIIPNIQSEYFSIQNNLIPVDTGKSDISIHRDFKSQTVKVDGFVRIGADTLFDAVTMPNPGAFYMTVLRETLLRNGISISGETQLFSDTLQSQQYLKKGFIIHRHQSPNGVALLSQLMKRSQNMYAEIMPRYLGYQRFGYGSFENGRKVIQSNLEKMGIAKNEYKYYDGSGLARYNYFSPNQFVSMLEYMYRSPYSAEWLSLFPVAGVDGTLKSRMKGTAAFENVHAKTGSLANVRSLSGYVTSKTGEPFVFSFLLNASIHPTRNADELTDRVLALIAGFNK